MNRTLAILSAGHYDSTTMYSKTKVTPLRTVQNYELELYLENQSEAYLNDMITFRKKGMLIFAKPGDTRKNVLPSSCIYVHFQVKDKKLAQELAFFPSFVHFADYEEAVALFNKIISHYASLNYFDNLLAHASITNLLNVIRHSNGKSTIQPSTQNIYTLHTMAMKYIDHMYTRKVSVSDIAKHCKVSTSYIYKIFQKISNTSPNEVILQRRIAEAQKLILLEKYSFTEIAEMCGFHSSAYFSDAFKRVTKMTPSQYKKLKSSYLHDLENII